MLTKWLPNRQRRDGPVPRRDGDGRSG